MTKIYDNITELIGQTPIVKLQHVPAESADVYVKLEAFNPGGSVKDRIALAMIRAAEADGRLKPGGTIVEPTSGNTGIGLAFVGSALGYKVVIVMPESFSLERRKLIQAYGAQLVLTPASGGMKAAIAKAKELSETEGYFLAMQFENPANPEIHEKTTGAEIIDAFGPTGLDAFVAGAGTGGTITGVSHALKKLSKLMLSKLMNLLFSRVRLLAHIKSKVFLLVLFLGILTLNLMMKSFGSKEMMPF